MMPAKEKRNKKILKRHRKGMSLREIASLEKPPLHHSTVAEIIERQEAKERDTSGVVDNSLDKVSGVEV